MEVVINDMLASGESTPDLGGSLKTTDVGERIAAGVRNWGNEPPLGRFRESPVLQKA